MNIIRRVQSFMSKSKKNWFNKKKTKDVMNIYRDELWRKKRDVVTGPPPPLPCQKMVEEMNLDREDGKFIHRKWWSHKRKHKFYPNTEVISAEWGGVRDDSDVIDVEAIEIPIEIPDEPKPMLLLDDPDRDKSIDEDEDD